MTADYVIRDRSGRFLTGNLNLFTGATDYRWTDSRGEAYTYQTRDEAAPVAAERGGLVTAYDAPSTLAPPAPGGATLDLFA